MVVMIAFRYPWLLLLLLAVPLATWWRYGRKGGKGAVGFSSGEALAGLPVSPWVRARWVLPALFAAGMGLLVLAVARPQKGFQESRVETEGVDIVLLADTSTSMREKDLGGGKDRLAAAKEVMAKFIEGRPDDRIGLVAFAAMPYALAPLTMDHDWLMRQMDRLQTGMLEDGTAIGDAVASAVNRLRDSAAKSKVVVLLTDGIHNAGKLSPLDAASAAGALGIKIYTVGACSGKPRTVSGLFGMSMAIPGDEIDEETLRKMAESTGGRYFRAVDVRSLEETYEAIDGLEKTEIEMDAYTRFEDRFAGFAWAALACLLAEAALSCGRLGRLPR